MEVHDILQEAEIKTKLQKKNFKRKNDCLRRPYKAVKRREEKSKGEKEGYKHLNTEFLGIARRDKKVFLSEQCKEI